MMLVWAVPGACEKGTGAGQFSLPHMLTVDSRGAVYVAEVTSRRVQKFVPKEK